MTKKIFALVMVVSMFGAIFASGCKKDDSSGTDTGSTTTSSTAGKTDTGGTTGDTAGKTTG